MYGLVDCNNFFVSCERVFRPDLMRKPVIVLSNNDGCAVARSEEAKALGIKMGQPFYQIKTLCERHQVHSFSSNFILYGDFSRRVDETLMQFSPHIENYSVDESFLDLSEIPAQELTDYGRQINQTVKQWTGIPTCIGIGPTKTLAKLANYCAKKMPVFRGVCDLSQVGLRQRLMPKIPVAEIWGVGRRTALKLHRMQIYTAADFLALDAEYLKQHFSIEYARLLQELKGVPCRHLDAEPEPQKGMAVTRSFGKRITDQASMLEAVSTYMHKAAEKLRKRKLVAGHVSVFMRTSHHLSSGRYQGAKSFQFPQATSDIFEMLPIARRLAKQIWRDGYAYAKAGIMLGDLYPYDQAPRDLFTIEASPERQKLLSMMDHLNQQMGAGTMKLAAVGLQQNWMMRSEQRSPRYTTDWDDLICIKS